MILMDHHIIRINRSWPKGLRISVVTMCHSFPMFLPLCDSQGSGSRKGSEPKSHSTMPFGDEHPLYHLFCIEGHRVLAPSRMVCRLLRHPLLKLNPSACGAGEKKPSAYLEGVLVYIYRFSLSCNW